MKQLAICISLANLYFIERWVRLIYDHTSWSLFAFYSTLDFLAIILNVLVMGVFLWLVLKLEEHHPKLRVLSLIIFGFVTVVVFKSLFLLVLTAIAKFPYKLPGFLTEGFAPLLIIGVSLGVFVCLVHYFVTKYFRQLPRIASTLLLILFPYALITLSQAVWVIYDNYPVSTDEFYQADVSEVNTKNRVLWLIFDEMDQRTTFLDRPEEVGLPEIDRFREEAIFATEAYPPGGSTALSMPSLTTGKLVTGVTSGSLYDLQLSFVGTEEPLWWEPQTNIFQEVKKMGLGTAAGGWAVPYHRIFNNYLDISIPGWRGEDKLLMRMYFQALDVMPFINHYEKRSVIAHQTILQSTKKVATNPDINLTLVHFMPPHVPWIYDRTIDDYEYSIISGLGSKLEGYFDNLVLVDRTIGSIRNEMEAEGLWDQTTILISSDHWWRDSHEFDGITDYRVPFMLKLAGQTKPVVFDKPFNTTVSHDLILSILKGNLTTTEESVEWLEDNHSKIEIPDYN